MVVSDPPVSPSGAEHGAASPRVAVAHAPQEGRDDVAQTPLALRRLNPRYPQTHRSGSWSWVVLVLGLGLALTLLAVTAKDLWFFGDDWEFLLHRGTVPGGSVGIWYPHNEHWSTIPILLYRGVFSVAGLSHFLPYMVPVLLAHLGVCLLLNVLLRRFGVRPWVAVFVALFVAFYGAGAEDTLWAFQIGFVGSLFFGLLSVWLSEAVGRGPLRVGLVWVALVASLMCSGVGLSVVGLVTVFVLLRRGLRPALVTLSVPVIVYLGWWIAIGRTAVRPLEGQSVNLPRVPEFVWTGLTSVWQLGTGVPASGMVVLAAVIGAALLVRDELDAARCLAVAGLAGALCHFALAGVTRASFGVDQAASSRYLYLGAVLMAPALALLLDIVVDRFRRPRWLSVVVAAVIAVFVLVNGVSQMFVVSATRTELLSDMPTRTVAAAQLVREDAPLLSTFVDPVFTPDLQVSDLRKPEIQAALPQHPSEPKALLSAASRLQVAVSTGPLDVPVATSMTFIQGIRPSPDPAPGCHDYYVDSVPSILLLPTGTHGAKLTYEGPSSYIKTVLYKDGLQGPPVDWPSKPGAPVTIGTSLAGATLDIRFTATGPTRLCLS